MSGDENKTYGAGVRTPSTGGYMGVQGMGCAKCTWGSEASFSSVCNAKVADHLATLADNTSSENQLMEEQFKPADLKKEEDNEFEEDGGQLNNTKEEGIVSFRRSSLVM